MPSVEVARLVLGYLSDQGLERTKSVFYQECTDLKSDDFNDWSNPGQKLSLIIEEYFILKGHDKQSKRTPENILQLLWKQFDALVGQLKHSTIHAVKEKTKASKIQSVKQGVRVRELNRQNKAGSFQRKNAKSVFVPNPDLVKAKNETVESVNSHKRPTEVCSFTANAIGALGKHDSSSSNGHKRQFLPLPSTWISKDDFQPVTSSGILQGNKFTESQKVVGGFNMNSPKRKSVQPKRRTAIAEITSKIPPSQSSADPLTVTHTSPDEIQLDLSSLVEKILGKPELSEKLAENINRAVEIDIPATPHEINDNPEKITNAATSVAVVNSDKVENIMDMMKTDPMFEEIFSSFETFNNSLEESDCGQNQDGEPLDFADQKQSLASSDSCATMATDALLLLAKSPGISSTKPGQSVSPVNFFQLPGPVYRTSPSSFSSIGSPPSSFPVLMSPGKTKSATNRAAQPIFSHVRQLDFSTTGDVSGASIPGGESSGKGNTTVDTNGTVVNKLSSASFPGMDGRCVGHGGNLGGENYKINIVGYKGISQCSQSDLSENDSGKGEGTSQAGPNDSYHSSENEENSLSVLEELATNAFAQRDESGGETEGGMKQDCLVIDTVGFKENEGDAEEHGRDLRGCGGNLPGDAAENGEDTEGCGYERNLTGDAAEHEGDNEEHVGDFRGDSGCVTIDEVKFRELTETKEEHQGETTSVIPRNNEHSSSVNDSSEKDCTVVVVDNEEQRGKDSAVKTELSSEYFQSAPDGVSGDSKEYKGKKRVKEEPVEVLLCKVNHKTPVALNTTTSAQVSKRKLKKNKKSSGTSKKRKALPSDLDVDKFLSRLHYIEEKS